MSYISFEKLQEDAKASLAEFLPVKDTLKVLFLGAIFPLLFYIVYLLLVSVLMRSLFYFGTFIPISILMFILSSGVSVISYRKTGNIITGAVVNALLLTFLIV